MARLFTPSADGLGVDSLPTEPSWWRTLPQLLGEAAEFLGRLPEEDWCEVDELADPARALRRLVSPGGEPSGQLGWEEWVCALSSAASLLGRRLAIRHYHQHAWQRRLGTFGQICGRVQRHPANVRDNPQEVLIVRCLLLEGGCLPLTF